MSTQWRKVRPGPGLCASTLDSGNAKRTCPGLSAAARMVKEEEIRRKQLALVAPARRALGSSAGPKGLGNLAQALAWAGLFLTREV
jgi:hypothetical protein